MQKLNEDVVMKQMSGKCRNFDNVENSSEKKTLKIPLNNSLLQMKTLP